MQQKILPLQQNHPNSSAQKQLQNEEAKSLSQPKKNSADQATEEKKSIDLVNEDQLQNIQLDMKFLDAKNKQHLQHRRR